MQETFQELLNTKFSQLLPKPAKLLISQRQWRLSLSVHSHLHSFDILAPFFLSFFSRLRSQCRESNIIISLYDYTTNEPTEHGPSIKFMFTRRRWSCMGTCGLCGKGANGIAWIYTHSRTAVAVWCVPIKTQRAIHKPATERNNDAAYNKCVKNTQRIYRTPAYIQFANPKHRSQEWRTNVAHTKITCHRRRCDVKLWYKVVLEKWKFI